MNRTWLLLVSMVALGSAVEAGEPTAKSLKKCPYGHTTLKNVRIVYGLPATEGPGYERWVKAQENLEYVMGGCVSGPDSPKYEVVCTRCRFAHSILGTDSPESGRWTKDSPVPNGFPVPMSDMVTSFPVMSPHKKRSVVSYSQSLTDKLDVDSESISYISSETGENLTANILEWLKTKGIEAKPTVHKNKSWDGTKYKIWELEFDNPYLSISLQELDEGSLSVRAYFGRVSSQAQPPATHSSP